MARGRVGEILAVVKHGHAHAVDIFSFDLAGRHFFLPDLE
jgi:hypothetical protein